MEHSSEAVRAVLQQFQDGYTARDVAKVDDFMTLFAPDEDIELIGIGAAKRAANEWFVGPAAIRDIVEGDWTYWGDVKLDVDGAQIHVCGEVAWLTTTGVLIHTQAFDKALPQYLQQMKELLENEEFDADTQLMEATHFGMRRLRGRGTTSGRGAGRCSLVASRVMGIASHLVSASPTIPCIDLSMITPTGSRSFIPRNGEDQKGGKINEWLSDRRQHKCKNVSDLLQYLYEPSWCYYLVHS